MLKKELLIKTLSLAAVGTMLISTTTIANSDTSDTSEITSAIRQSGSLTSQVESDGELSITGAGYNEDLYLDSNDILVNAAAIDQIDKQLEGMEGGSIVYDSETNSYYIEDADGNKTYIGAVGTADKDDVLSTETFSSFPAGSNATGELNIQDMVVDKNGYLKLVLGDTTNGISAENGEDTVENGTVTETKGKEDIYPGNSSSEGDYITYTIADFIEDFGDYDFKRMIAYGQIIYGITGDAGVDATVKAKEIFLGEDAYTYVVEDGEGNVEKVEGTFSLSEDIYVDENGYVKLRATDEVKEDGSVDPGYSEEEGYQSDTYINKKIKLVDTTGLIESEEELEEAFKSKIRDGVTLFGYEGTYTEEETDIAATADDIGDNSVGFVNGELIVGNGKTRDELVQKAIKDKESGITGYIFFDTNGGSGGGNIVVSTGKSIGVLPYGSYSTRTGYTWDDIWYTARVGGSRIYNNQTVTSSMYAGKTYYIHWDPILYNIKTTLSIDGETENLPFSFDDLETSYELTTYTYDYSKFTTENANNQGGTDWSSSTTTKNNLPTAYTIEQSLKLADLSMEGYTFDGWTNNGKINVKSTGDKELVASFSSNTYSVNFIVGDEVSKVEATYNKEYEIPYDDQGLSDNLDKDGYTFIGWTDTEGSSSVLIADEDKNGTFKNLTTENDVTINLYPVYQGNVYNITYDAGNGTNNPDNPINYTTGNSYELYDATLDGYTFNGWYDQNGNKISKITEDMYGDLTLTAKYTANAYNIVYNANGGSVSPSSKTVTYNSKIGSMPTPTRSGYTFAGWYTAASGGTNYTSDTVYKIVGDKTLYAHWNVVTYSISYNYNGGSGSNVANYTIETATFTLNNPSRSGWTFTGWSGSGSGTTVTIAKGSTGNKSYTANWSCNHSSVSESSEYNYNRAAWDTPDDVSSWRNFDSEFAKAVSQLQTYANGNGHSLPTGSGSWSKSTNTVLSTRTQYVYTYYAYNSDRTVRTRYSIYIINSTKSGSTNKWWTSSVTSGQKYRYCNTCGERVSW